MNDAMFHWIFVFVFVGFSIIRAYYHRLARRGMGKAEYVEGRTHIALRLLFGIPFMLIVVTYMVRPSVLGWARLDLPVWAQWVGVALGLASLPLIWWVQSALGRNFSTVLHVREEHSLVTSGPYRWVRHPMYTVLYMNLTAAFLLTENWLIGAVFLLSLSLIVFSRVGREELVMVDKFGDQYRAYMRQTGRFLPRFSLGR
jgi:protein-S-isoprenylcysteine O-methyltransferase Ste14